MNCVKALFKQQTNFVLDTAEVVEGDHHSLIVKQDKEEKAFPTVGAQSSVPVGISQNEVTIPEESQRAGATQMQSKPIMLDGKSFN